ncbi:MAG TPA: PQQ-binding-like beta-propeller repeat protein [Verrucomicrobiota bacterium]|nr:PQQ-binding-like beta-propeller repeat protein [Verrucomicrobiota bacterium]
MAWFLWRMPQDVVSADQSSAEALLRQIGVTKGICALPGDRDCKLALSLARESELIFYVQLTEEAEVEAARQLAYDAGFYGTRVFVEQGPRDHLHLADDIADALIAADHAEGMPLEEALRVVHPQAKVILGTRQETKRFPEGIDDWSHPYHRPDNNPVSEDKRARGPYLTQFLSDPRYAPLPQVAVSAAGRVFKAFGHIAFKEREEPWLNTLAAFNGYNGTLLWRREIAPALMVHRNTLIATATNVYFADDRSCKVFDARTGELKDEIAPPVDEVGGAFWKWMALEGNVLYAMIGGQESRDPTIKARLQSHGWPWDPLSPGFNRADQPWGYGKTLVAIELANKRILWRYREEKAMDARALCMKGGRIYAFSFGNYLTCLDASTGGQIYRHTPENAPQLFKTLGEYQNRQDWRSNWRTTALLRCSDEALYFAGPALSRLVAVTADTGKVLWSHPYSNYQLILQGDYLYGISGQIDNEVSRKFDPLTGKVLAELKVNRRACTRPTASSDAIFFRADEGSVRLDLQRDQAQLVSPMRPNCHDGVTVPNGLLYWWPSVCDCNLTLYGITCLGPAGDFDFNQSARESTRLVTVSDGPSGPGLSVDAADWPVFRANHLGTTTASVAPDTDATLLWDYKPKTAYTPSAPTAAGSLAFVGGSDGSIRALDTRTGKEAWITFTGGDVRLPPTLSAGRALVGSGDGWVYALDAKTGKRIWSFRAAPIERRIPVYGTLQSTWPAASGVLVDNNTAYVAAGLANFDGTHVYALNVATGKIRWQNNRSGHLDDVSHTGVGVQGHMLIHKGRLFLAGGNAVSPAEYDLSSGECLNASPAQQSQTGNIPVGSIRPRGWELYLVGDEIHVAGKPYYAHPQYPVYDASVLNKTLFMNVAGYDLAWANNAKVMCFSSVQRNRAAFQKALWGKIQSKDFKPAWEFHCPKSVAVAAGPGAIVIASPGELAALALQDGRLLWKKALPAVPVPWGLAINREGKVLVTLEGGRVLCYGK